MIAQVGLAILNSELKPVFFNAEARKIVTFSLPGQNSTAIEQVALRELESIAHRTSRLGTPEIHEYVSGRRKYLVRIMSSADREIAGGIKLPARQTPSAVLLLERTGHQKFQRLDEIGRRYDLTGRERETVALLCHGFTSKQIAERMKVSPNTVKVFLRLVMLKMDVSTRSAIIGKLVDSSM